MKMTDFVDNKSFRGQKVIFLSLKIKMDDGLNEVIMGS